MADRELYRMVYTVVYGAQTQYALITLRCVTRG